MEISAKRITRNPLEALEELVNHFNQSVHEVDERPPYFDPLLGHPPKVSQLVKFWLDCLTPLSSESILDWVGGYITRIRPLLFESTVGCVPVLQNYELVLSQWSSHIDGISISQEEISSSMERISRTIEVLSSDITIFSSGSLIKFSTYIRCNILIPSLLRILHEVLHLVSKSSMKTELGASNRCIVRCVVALLMFDAPRLDPPIVAPSLALTDDNLLEKICAYPPQNLNHNKIINSLLSLESVAWTPVTLEGNVWSDPITGISSRSADLLWMKIASTISLSDLSHAVGSLSSTKSKKKGKDLRVAIMRALGITKVASTVRAHFFGRDILLWKPEERVSSQVILGKRVDSKKPITDQKPFRSVPSRIHAALSFIRLLDEDDSPSTKEILANILPICFELIDSSESTFVALGGSALLHILDHLDQKIDCWRDYIETSIAILNKAFDESNLEGPVLVVLGQAQSRIFKLYPGETKKRRQVSGKWLSLLHQSSARSVSVPIVWEIAVGGVIPLLYQHAELPNADSIEMCRKGLAALLPLTCGDTFNSKTQIASFIALINLMVGSYPIMHRHGGKIMSYLLSSIASLRLDCGDEKIATRLLGIHTAAVASVICGPRFAGELLKTVEKEDLYQETLKQVLVEVQACTSNLERSVL